MENNDLYQKKAQELLELIKDKFSAKNGKIDSNKIKKTPEVLNKIYELTNNIPNKENIPIRDLIWCIKNGFNEVPKCKTCGKEMPLRIERGNKRYPQGYIRQYCSLKCFNNDPKRKLEGKNKNRNKTIEKKFSSLDKRISDLSIKKQFHHVISLLKKYKFIDSSNRYKIQKIKKYLPQFWNIIEENFKKLNIDLHEKLSDLQKDQRKIYIFFNQLNSNDLKCKVCGKPIQWFEYNNPGKFCSNQCRKIGGEFIAESLIKSNLEKYRIKSTAQLDSTKEKFKKTMLEKYGVKAPIYSSEISKKMKEKWGAEYPFSNDEIKNKAHEILKSKYEGLPLENENIRKKTHETFFIKNLISKGFDEEKAKKLWNIWNDKKYWEKNFLNEKKEVLLQKILETFKIPYRNLFTVYDHIKRLGLEFNSIPKYSQAEKEIVEYIKSIYSGEIIENDRQLIKPLELDIVIPEKKIAIEFDGLYWHSFNQKDLVNEFKYKHLIKTIKAEEKGYNLLQIFENEWVNPKKQDIWKSVIGYKLGYVKYRYYARKLKVTKVDNKFMRMFFDENHLQGGKAAGAIRLALYDPKSGEIVSMMTFAKPRYAKNAEYELIRFASKKFTACVGCAQKLFKHFIKLYQPKSVISYANRRWASKHSNLYQKLGFKYIGDAEPNYFYFKLSDPELRLWPRVTFQKHKLESHPDTRDYYLPELTETEIMFNAGFRRIYDCGNLVFKWEAKNV